jgi:hypothetical protein
VKHKQAGDDDIDDDGHADDDGFKDDDKIVKGDDDETFFNGMKIYHDPDRYYHDNGEQWFFKDNEKENGPKWNSYLETVAGEKYKGGDSGIHPISYPTVDRLPGFRKNNLIKGLSTMYWKVDEQKGVLHIILVAKTTGGLGFGLSEKGSIPGSDMVIAWVDGEGKVHAEDRWAKDHTKPLLDGCQDWHTHGGMEKNGHTTVHLWRKLITADAHQDRPIVKSQHMYVMYATGKTDKFELWGSKTCGGCMGYQFMKLYGPDNPYILRGSRHMPNDATAMVLATPIHIPHSETNTICTAYDLGKMKGKYLVGIDPVLRWRGDP